MNDPKRPVRRRTAPAVAETFTPLGEGNLDAAADESVVLADAYGTHFEPVEPNVVADENVALTQMLTGMLDGLQAEGMRLAPKQTAAVVKVIAPWASYAKALIAVIGGFLFPAAATFTGATLNDGISSQELLTALVAGLIGSGVIGTGVYGVRNTKVTKPTSS